MANERLDTAKAFSQGEYLRRLRDALGSLRAARGDEREHAAEAAHLAFCKLVTWMPGQARVVDLFDVGSGRKKCRDRARVLFMLAHAQCKRFHPAKRQIGIEGSGHAANRVLMELDRLMQIITHGGDETANGIRVAANVLRG